MSYINCEDEVIGVWGDSSSTGSRGGSPGGGQGAKPRKSGSRDGVPAGVGAEPNTSNLKRLTKKLLLNNFRNSI